MIQEHWNLIAGEFICRNTMNFTHIHNTALALTNEGVRKITKVTNNNLSERQPLCIAQDNLFLGTQLRKELHTETHTPLGY